MQMIGTKCCLSPIWLYIKSLFLNKIAEYLQIVMSRNQFTNCALKKLTSNFPILFLGYLIHFIMFFPHDFQSYRCTFRFYMYVPHGYCRVIGAHYLVDIPIVPIEIYITALVLTTDTERGQPSFATFITNLLNLSMLINSTLRMLSTMIDDSKYFLLTYAEFHIFIFYF